MNLTSVTEERIERIVKRQYSKTEADNVPKFMIDLIHKYKWIQEENEVKQMPHGKTVDIKNTD